MTKQPPNETTARRLFSQRMRAAGWERMKTNGFAWEHTETGLTWEGLNWTATQGIVWRWYFECGETPPPTGER